MNIQYEKNNTSLSTSLLKQQNYDYQGTGGVSEENKNYGFKPAFLDKETGTVYLARYSDGRIAPMHLIEGLPDKLIVERSSNGAALSIKEKIIAGFTRYGFFYTREQAAKAVSF